MYNLKTFSILFALPFLLFSCTKEFTQTISGPRISKIKTNGKLSTEYIYNSNNYVQKSISYDTLGKIISSTTNEYLNGKIYKKIYSNSSYYNLYEFNDGLIEKVSLNRTLNDSTINYTKYIYDVKKQCIQINSYLSNDSLPNFIIYMKYVDGNRSTSEYYSVNSNSSGAVTQNLNYTLYYKYDNKIFYAINQSDLTLTPNLNNCNEISSPNMIKNGGVLGTDGSATFKVTSKRNNTTFNITYKTDYGNFIYQYNAENFPIKITYPGRVVEYEYIQ